MPQVPNHNAEAFPHKNLTTSLVALGSNLCVSGLESAQLLGAAAHALAEEGFEVVLSPLFATPAFPANSGPDYVNGAAILTGTGAPEEILALLHRIEERFGRERTQRWGARTLDIDLLGQGGAVLPDLDTWRRWRDLSPEAQQREAPDRLILPHPRLQDRAFVLVPLAEIAPDWAHPVTGLTVRQMRDALPETDLQQIRMLSSW